MAAPTREVVRLAQNVLKYVPCKSINGQATTFGVASNQTLSCGCFRLNARTYNSNAANQHQGPDVISDHHGNVFHVPGTSQERGVGLTSGEQTWRMLCLPDHPPNSRLLRLSIIGRPNCGKSTLTNQLMGWRVSSVSNKVHTTRKRTLGVWTHDETQIVFLDTPGIIRPENRHRHNLEKSLVTDPHQSVETADLVAVVVDVSKPWNRSELDKEILKALHMNPTTPAVLVLNKVDLVKDKNVLLMAVHRLTAGVVEGKEFVKPRKSNRLTLTEFVSSAECSDNANGSSESESLTGESGNKLQEVDSERLNCVTNSDTENSTERTKLLDSTFLSEESNLISQSESTVVKTIKRSDNLYSEHEDSESEESGYDSDQSSESVDYQKRLKEVKRLVQKETGWSKFYRVFMVSALTGDGVKEFKNYLLGCAKPGDWMYHSSLVTDQDPMEIARTCVWEQLLDNLRDEIPYNLDLDVVFWDVNASGRLKVAVDIYCYKQRYIRAAMGQRGDTIRRVSIRAEEELKKTFQCDVFLKVRLKMKAHK